MSPPEVTGICNPASFRSEARYQRTCAVCGRPGRFLAHHVIYEQHLTAIGLRGNALYDPRNARGVHVHCHQGHHRGKPKIKTRELTDDNIAYAFEALGARAYDYFQRRYDDTAEDPRIKLALEAAT